MPRALRAIAAAAPLLAALTAAGCGSHRSVADMAGSVPIPPGTERLVIDVVNGSIGLVTVAGPAADGSALGYIGGVRRGAPTAELLAVLEAVPLAITAEPDPSRPGTLAVRLPRVPRQVDAAGEPLERNAVFGFELAFTVPRGLAVEVRVTGSGHLSARDVAAPLVFHTGRGDLRLERCAGAVQANTGRGTVIVTEHEGDLDVRVGVGEMQVFVKKPGARLALVTNEGNVQCYVPADLGFALDARAEIGKLANGFGVPMERVGEFGAVMRGARGDARTAIVLRTGKGHLSLGHKVFR